MITGRCLCGRISYELAGPHNWVGHCHCDSCRRGAGAPLVTFVGHPNGQWRWTADPPSVYESSPGNFRYFCANCGSSLAYGSDRYPDEIHFHVGTLDEPNAVVPDSLFHADERLSWMPEQMPGCGHG